MRASWGFHELGISKSDSGLFQDETGWTSEDTKRSSFCCVKDPCPQHLLFLSEWEGVRRCRIRL